MQLQAPAKINLHLCVGKRRDDGFHPLLTWMCTIGLFDTLKLERGRRTPGQSGFELSSDCKDLSNDSGNLVYRAADALADTLCTVGEGPGNPRREEVSVHLEKRIPIGAGLGGGSSDAAATLLGLNELWACELSREELSFIAAGIGSDVPFFLFGPCSICTGRGEKIHAVAPPAARFALVILPRMPISTADVYQRFDELHLGDDHAIAHQPPWQEWSKLPADQLLRKLVNNLEPAAFSLVPQLARMREQIELSLGRPVRMSGSGSSLFTLFDDRSSAEAAARILGGAIDASADIRVVDIAPVT